jgi:hypothetical protein
MRRRIFAYQERFNDEHEKNINMFSLHFSMTKENILRTIYTYNLSRILVY